MVMTRDRAYGGLYEILRRVYHSQEVEMFVAEFLKQWQVKGDLSTEQGTECRAVR